VRGVGVWVSWEVDMGSDAPGPGWVRPVRVLCVAWEPTRERSHRTLRGRTPLSERTAPR